MSVLEEAIAFATKAHSEQTRKLSGTPYILHPLEVAAIIATMTTDQEVMAAGVLHDTIEDCGVLPEEIAERFGKRVFALVQSETEDKMPKISPEASWQARKEDSLLMLSGSKDVNVKILWLGDKLSNIRSFAREYARIGEDLWNHFHQNDPKMQEWYYRSVARAVPELAGTAAYREYLSLIDQIFGER